MNSRTSSEQGELDRRGGPGSAAARDGQRLRILFVVDSPYPTLGGAEIQARLLAGELRRMGHDIRVLAPRRLPGQAQRERVDGVEVFRLGHPRWKGLGALILNVRYAAWLLRHQHRIDVIHIHMMHNLAGAAGWLKPWLRVPVMVKISGAAEFRGGILDPDLRNKAKHRLLDRGARRLQAYQCISRETVGMVESAAYPSERLRLIPNAVDVARFAFPQRRFDSASTVLFIGRHAPVKALDVLLQAWARLPRAPQARLILAGEGPQTPMLRQMAQQLGIAESVEFPGTIDDVAPLLRRADIYVQPSHQEGLSNAVLEAMSASLPIVASRISGNEDLIDDGQTGLLVAPGDPQALAQAIGRLMESSALRSDLGLAAARKVEARYGLPTVIDSLLRTYRGLMR